MPGARHLDNAEPLHTPDKTVHLFGLTGNFNGHGFFPDIQHPAAVALCRLEHSVALLRLSFHLHQQQLAV